MDSSIQDISEISNEMATLGDEILRTLDTIAAFDKHTGPSLESSIKHAIFAGTGVEADDINISLENKENIIIQLLKKLGEMIVRFFKSGYEILTNLDPMLKYYTIRINNLVNSSKIESRKTLKSGQKIELGRNARFFKAGHEKLGAGIRLSSEIKRRADLLEYIAGNYLDRVEYTFRETNNLVTQTGKLNVSRIQEVLTSTGGLKSVLTGLSMTPVTSQRFGSNTFSSKPYIGDKAVYFIDREVSPVDLKGLIFYGPRYENATESVDMVSSKASVEAVKPSDLVHTVASIKILLDAIAEAKKVRVYNKLKDMERDSLRTVQALSNMKSSDPENFELARRAVTYQVAWMRNIFRPILVDTSLAMRALTSYTLQSIKLYE